MFELNSHSRRSAATKGKTHLDRCLRSIPRGCTRLWLRRDDRSIEQNHSYQICAPDLFSCDYGLKFNAVKPTVLGTRASCGLHPQNYLTDCQLCEFRVTLSQP